MTSGEALTESESDTEAAHAVHLLQRKPLRRGRDRSTLICAERRSMHLHDIMTRDVEVIRPNATVQEAAQKMDELNVGPLPVCDGERLVGMVTDRDIVVRGAAAGMDPKTTPVSEVMTRDVITCAEHADVDDAVRIMEVNQIRRLLVLGEDQRLVGIVSLGDLAIQADGEELAGEVLQEISEPSEPDRS
jgi:CBS domain-containing protein